jgi:hypothetical protein
VTSAGAKPSLASAAAAGGQSGGGLGGTALAGIMVLGLGLAGITGGALVTASRRRRATSAAGARKH